MKFILRGLMFEINLSYFQFKLGPIQLTCGYSCTSRYMVCLYILKLILIQLNENYLNQCHIVPLKDLSVHNGAYWDD